MKIIMSDYSVCLSAYFYFLFIVGWQVSISSCTTFWAHSRSVSETRFFFLPLNRCHSVMWDRFYMKKTWYFLILEF